MKKITLLICAVVLFMFAQSQTKPHFIAINIGASIPTGDYGKAEGNNTDGFANTGVNFAIEGAGFINNTVGFGAYLGGTAHNIDADAYISQLNKQPGIRSSTITADPYGISNYMVGLYLSVPASDIVSFRFKLMGGLFIATNPDMTITFTDDNFESYYIQMTETSASKFAPLIGASALFKVSRRIGLAANFEYTGAECEFTYNAGTENMTFEQKFAIFNITAGLNIMLGPQE